MSQDVPLPEPSTAVDHPITAMTSADVARHLDEVFLDLECFSAGELSKLCISKDFFGTTTR